MLRRRIETEYRMLKRREIKIQGFDGYAVGDDDAKHTIVLLHGYGADASDLVPLSSAVDPESRYRWFFLNAPNRLPPQFGGGRSWFDLPADQLMRVVSNQEPFHLEEFESAGLEAIGKKLFESIQEISESEGRLILGGFSQGAMVAIEASLKIGERVNGLALFSGTLIHKSKWTANLPNLLNTQYFQSHGHQDPLLSFSSAQALNALLTKSGLSGEFYPFSGGHEIPFEVLSRFRVFLENVFLCSGDSIDV